MKYTLGTVCKLKGIDLEILIIGYNGKGTSNDYVYEYIGCLLSEGFTNNEKLYRFNTEHIETILYEGYNKSNINNKDNVNNPIIPEKKEEHQEETSPNEQKEEYIFDENGVLIEIKRPEPKQEVAESKAVQQVNNTPVTLESIDINNL